MYLENDVNFELAVYTIILRPKKLHNYVHPCHRMEFQKYLLSSSILVSRFQKCTFRNINLEFQLSLKCQISFQHMSMSTNLYSEVAVIVYLYSGAAKSRHVVFADSASLYKGDHLPIYQTDTKVPKS